MPISNRRLRRRLVPRRVGIFTAAMLATALLGIPALAQNYAPPPADRPPPPPPARTDNPGLVDEIQKLLKTPSSLLPSTSLLPSFGSDSKDAPPPPRRPLRHRPNRVRQDHLHRHRLLHHRLRRLSAAGRRHLRLRRLLRLLRPHHRHRSCRRWSAEGRSVPRRRAAAPTARPRPTSCAGRKAMAAAKASASMRPRSARPRC